MTAVLRLALGALTLPDELALEVIALSPQEAELRLRRQANPAEGEWAPRLRIQIAHRTEHELGLRMAHLLGTLRVQLTDAVVVEAAPLEDHPTLADCWHAVLGFRTGLVAQTMYLFMADVAQEQVVLTGACVAEESDLFGPYFRAVVLGLELEAV